MTRHLIDPHVERALERLMGNLDDLAREYGLTDEDVRNQLKTWGLPEAWDEWCEQGEDR